MSLRIKSSGVTIQKKATEQYFHNVLLNLMLFFTFAGLFKPYAFFKNSYSCTFLNRPFQSYPMPLFQSEAKCEAIHIYSPAKKDSFSQERFFALPRFESESF